jgi:hypothetical protein
MIVLAIIGPTLLVVAGYFFYMWYRRYTFLQPDSSNDVNPTDIMDTTAIDYRGRTDLPLGIQNNNPGNLRPNGDHWQGWVDTWKGGTGEFMIFVSLRYGIRAAAKNIATLIGTYKTIRRYISAYAPSSENDTAGYISFVSAHTGFDPDQPLTLNHATLKALLIAHFYQENGADVVVQYIPDSEIEAGLALTPWGA